MVLRSWLAVALCVGAVLSAVSCDPELEASAEAIFVTPVNNQRVAQGPVTVRVRWVANQCTVDSIALFAAGAYVGTSAVPPDTCIFTWDASGVEPGTRPRVTAAVHFSFLDEENRWHQRVDSTSINVLVDTGGPDVRVVSPRDGDTLERGDVAVVAWAKDESGGDLDRVEFFVDDVQQSVVRTSQADTWRYTWDATQSSPGGHTVKAMAYNTYGEYGVDAVWVFVRDTSSGGGPTYHHGYLDSSETWSPAGNPHIVDGDVSVRNGAWLTIEPGCVVKAEDFAIVAGYIGPGGIRAVGRSDAPILFTSNSATPAPGDWGGIVFSGSTLAGSRLEYCIIEYAGYGGSDVGAVSIMNRGHVDEISNCTIRRGGRNGVFCRDGSTFGTFRGNVVTDNLGYALRIGPLLAERLEAGNDLTGNDSAGVELFGRLSASATWPNIGMPYVIKDVSVGDSTNDVVLTIEPGVEVRFKRDGVLAAGSLGRNLRSRIVADGSAGRIRFTSLAATPAPGDFYGVSVHEGPSAQSEFRNCDFAYGGHSSGDFGILFARGCYPVITGCDFGFSEKWGIVFLTSQVPDTTALKQVNTFHDNGLGAVKWLRLLPGP